MSPKTLAFTAALVLAAATAPAPASANFWGELAELDRKKAAIDARVEETLASFKNATISTLEHAVDKAEEKVSVDKEEMAKSLTLKLQNLTAMKESLEEQAASLKVNNDKKFWHLMNKTEGVKEAKKGAFAALANKTMASMDKNEEAVKEMKEANEKASDERKEEMDKAMGAKAKEAGEKAQLAVEKLANLTGEIGEGLEAKAAAVAVKLNASKGAAEDKAAAFDGWKEGLLNVSLAKHASLEDKLNATLAAKDETQKERAEAMEEKAKAFTDGLMDLEKAKDGHEVKVIEGDADAHEGNAKLMGGLAAKLANVTDKVEGKLAAAKVEVEELKQERAVMAKTKFNATMAAAEAKLEALEGVKGSAFNKTAKAAAPKATDLGAAASSLKLPSVRKSIPGVGSAFFASDPAAQAAGDGVPGSASGGDATTTTAPTSGSGVSSAVGSAGPPAATAAFQVELPKSTTADWTPAKQTAFTAAVAAWAKVPAEAVTIQAVSSDGGVIDTAVDFADEAAAAGFARRLASDGAGLAAATTAAGLGAAKPTDVKVAGADAAPAATGAGAAGRGSSSSAGKTAGLSPGAIAGITVGSAAGAALLAAAVGAGVAVSRKRRGAGGTPLTNA